MKYLLLCFTLVCSIHLTGCGGSLPEADFVFINGSEHNYLDPQKMSWAHDVRIARCLYDTLVQFDFNDLSIHPGAAERWDISDDQTTYTFHIRADAKWSNGDPVTAHDYIYAWRRALLPDTGADYAKLLFTLKGGQAFFTWRQEQLKQYLDIKNKVADSTTQKAQDAAHAARELTESQFTDMVGLRAPDDRTLVVELERPVPYFLELVAYVTFSPVHQPSVEAATTVNTDTGIILTDASYWSSATRLVTNGPYQIAERRFKQYLYMTANPHFWNREVMKNNSILERIIEDPQTALRTYDDPRENIHMWVTVPAAGPLGAKLIAAQRQDVHPHTIAGTYFYNFNCLPKRPDGSDNPLADVRVRRALSMAIDRNIIVDKVTGMRQPVARTFVPPNTIKGYTPPVDSGIGFDPQRARALLAEAGYPNGEGLGDLTLLYNTGNYHEQAAQVVKQMWHEHLGVTINLEGQEVKVFGDRLNKQDFSIARAAWIGDYPDPTTFLDKMSRDNHNNDPKWSNPIYDELLEQAASTTDLAKRMQLLQDAERILLQEAPMALIYHYINIVMFDPDKVKGITPNTWNRWNFERAWVVN